ncbi:MAG TPA: G1 family glutamic endopeptidase [Candidatus Sulfotelmatobacter sp.]|nr:G1 family glutamic endopeptidase [Candidatus Sulfotelmatobacter sp.]
MALLPITVEPYGGVTANTTRYYNWSGYVATSSSRSAYSSAETVYNEPQALSTPCSNNAAVTWAGLGGYTTGTLAQDGTGINTPGLGQHQAWSEILPDQPYIQPQPLYGHAGYGFIAEVNLLGGGGGFNFYMYDRYTGYGLSYQEFTNSYDASSADFIVERPTYNGKWMNLTNFAYLNFLDAWVNGNQPSNGVGHYPNDNVNMVNNANTYIMAQPGGLSNNGQTFTDYYKNCQG